MKCALCNLTEADKKNTHFLTDSIIRSCLNENGENIREKGFYFDLSNENPFVEFNFQKRTTPQKLESALGREPSETEIEKAKHIPFSVDFVFCVSCEKKFTSIEDKFINKHLRNFRINKYTNEFIELDDFKVIKSFFLLQIWRTSICDPLFEINSATSELLRLAILNNESISADSLRDLPLSVTYLTTGKDGVDNGANFVAYSDDRNPNWIIMNDFVIQFFDDNDSISFFDFYGLNDSNDYLKYLNTDLKKFIFKILTQEQRLLFLKDFLFNNKIKELSSFYSENFSRLWHALFGHFPSQYLVKEYLIHLTREGNNKFLQYTKENIFELTGQFIESKLK